MRTAFEDLGDFITVAVGFDRHTERWGLGASMRRAGISRSPAETLGILCSWAIFILFASLGILTVNALTAARSV